MNSFKIIFFILLLSIGNNNAVAQTFEEFISNNCDVDVTKLSANDVMLKTGICVGYFSAFVDYLESQNIICKTEGLSTGVLTRLSKKKIARKPELGKQPAHVGVMTIISVYYLCNE